MNDAFTALRQEAAAVFASSELPSFKYGLNVFFAPSSVLLPNDVVSGANPDDLRNHPQDTFGFTDVDSLYAVNDSVGRPGFAPRGVSPNNISSVIAPAEVHIMLLSEAMADPRFSEVVRARLSLADGDRIDAWNIASLTDGIFVYVPAGVRASSPVRIDVRMTESHRADCTVVLAEAGSTITIVEHLASEGVDAKLRASRTEIIALEGAHVTHVSVQDFGNTVTSFDRRRADVASGASVSWTDCAFGGGFVRSRIATDLSGEGASAGVMGMTFASTSQRFDLRHEVAHLASRTESAIRTRIGLDDSAKAIYRSVVRIAPNTVGCVGLQKEDTLLLSPDVEIDAMPDLEIGTGEVRARHSASAGKLDREKLFYLMSRGLSEQAAAKTLIDAFFAPIVTEMRHSGLEDMVECLVAGRLEDK